MLYTKSCARCHGDVTRVADVGDTYFSCVQCGFVTYAEPKPAVASVVGISAAKRFEVADRAEIRRRQLRRRTAQPMRSAA